MGAWGVAQNTKQSSVHTTFYDVQLHMVAQANTDSELEIFSCFKIRARV